MDTVTYVYTDPQGTPLAEADASGIITATFDYAPYGSQAMGTPPDGPGYTGHVNDPESGLVYMQARYYDPSVGRFVSTDPVGPVAGNVFNFNRFAYANNNPVVNMDPDGRCTGTLLCGKGEGVGGVGNIVGMTFVMPSDSEGGSSGSSASIQTGKHASGCDGSIECDQVKGTRRKIVRNQVVAVKKAGILAGKLLAINVLTDRLGGLIGEAAEFVGLGRKIKLVDGYYEAEGSPFKFSEYYYNRLESTGRLSPFMQAQEVLETATEITPDTRFPGYFRYDNGVLEMVYNPSTKDVWHIKPIGRR